MLLQALMTWPYMTCKDVLVEAFWRRCSTKFPASEHTSGLNGVQETCGLQSSFSSVETTLAAFRSISAGLQCSRQRRKVGVRMLVLAKRHCMMTCSQLISTTIVVRP